MGGQPRAAAEPRARRRGASVYTPPLQYLPSLHREALGPVSLVTDNQGDEVERTYFDPFGEKTDALGGGTSPLLGAVKLGFTGHRHDDELGLIDAKGRVYDPAQKRFLTPDIYLPDPLSSQRYNRYSYVANNPLRNTDPTGFLPSPADQKAKGSTQPDGGTAAPAPAPPVLLGPIAPVTVIRAKADDTGNSPPPHPIHVVGRLRDHFACRPNMSVEALKPRWRHKRGVPPARA